MSNKMPKPTYVFASCKPWHLKSFQMLAKKSRGRWIYVADPRRLVSVLAKRRPRYIFFPHWSWMVPQSVWEKHECVCFHMTDVPYGRGGSPLQNLTLKGHTKTKITALRMVGELDAGPVYMKRNLSLHGRAEDIYQRAGRICVAMINRMVKQQPKPFPQKGVVVKFERRKPSESRLPKMGTLSKWYDWIRMLDAATYPRAFLKHGDFRIEFHSAVIRKNKLEAKVVITRGALKK
jgi:methionyl-tRNA formyltransferase